MKYDDYFKGKYIFHFHTNVTDGQPSIKEYFEYASKNSIEKLIFLEHIRRKPTYGVESFVSEVKMRSVQYGIPSFVGFEAKILIDGSLDISTEHLEIAEVLGIAEHGFPSDTDLLISAFGKVIDSLKSLTSKKTIIWVHPGLWFKKRGLLKKKQDVYIEMLKFAMNSGILIEKNRKFNLVPDYLVGSIPENRLVVGIDAHSIEDLPI